MSYLFKANVSEEEFDAFAAQHPCASILQQSAWAHVKKEWKSILILIYENEIPVGGTLLLIRELVLGYRLGYLPRGPLLDFNNEQLNSFFFEELKKFGSEQNLISIKFDPNIYKSVSLEDKNETAHIEFQLPKQLSAYHIVHHGYLLDMYDSTQPRFQLAFPYRENWKDYFPKKTKEKIRTAITSFIEIEEKDESSVEPFQKMIAYTEKRKGIVLRDQSYFHRIMQAFQDKSVMLFAYINNEALFADVKNRFKQLEDEYQQLEDKAVKKKEMLEKRLGKLSRQMIKVQEDLERDGSRVLISALLLVKDNRTTELLYSGLNEQYREYYAPYLLREKAIEWAFRHGCNRFNFGGVQGTLDDGLFEFKSSFRPQIDVYVGEFDLIIKPFLYKTLDSWIPKIKKLKLFIAKRRNHS